MREIALGRLLYTPARFGSMLVGDFLDALSGYIEGENNRMRSIAELIRTATTILWNKQIGKENVLPAEQLWRFPWDSANIETEELGEESLKEREKIQETQTKFLMDNFPDT
ncbi:MAG: hypothetical protein NTW82_14020 [Bacteroidia bacterium]|nr:hypothetical protein [Bacteroidia bacterium]